MMHHKRLLNLYVTTTKICVNWWKKKSTCSLEFDTQLQCIYQRQLGKKGEKLKEILNIIFSYFALIWHNINNHNIDEKKTSDPSVNYSNHTYNRTLCGWVWQIYTLKKDNWCINYFLGSLAITASTVLHQ